MSQLFTWGGQSIGVCCHALLQGDLPNPGTEPAPLAAPTLQADSLPLSHQRSPIISDKFSPIYLLVPFFSFLYFILFNFIILYWFCQISKWICHRYTCVPHPEPSSLLSPHTIPLGRPSAPAPSIQYRASNLDWQLVSYIILYVFECHSPKSSHPLPLPQSPKDCSIHQCLFGHEFE